MERAGSVARGAGGGHAVPRRRHGAFPMLPGMTVMQALTSAGGFTPFAKMKSIYVLRDDNGKKVKFQFNYKAVVNGKNADQDIELKAGDTIVVP